MKYLLPTLVLWTAAASAAEAPPSKLLDSAIAEAKARHAAVFVDFSAVWCHSCYFMEKQVMTGGEWDAVKKRAVIVEADGDSPDGSAAARQFRIVGFPTYVVLDETGGEVGRILGDRPRAQFYAELEPMLSRGASLEHWQSLVKDTGPESVAAGRTVVEGLYQRADPVAALGWIATLREPIRESLLQDPRIADLDARLQLLASADQGDADACIRQAAAAIAVLDCDHLGEMSQFQACLAKLPAAQQHAALAPFKPRMQRLQQDVLVKGTGVCSDTRGVVEVAADLYEGLDDRAARAQVLDQGVKYSAARLKGKLGADRNLADNLRFYRELQQDDAALDALYPKLIAAYPDDYVYAYRWGRSLAKRGKFEQALPLLEQAAPKSFGRNRLWVAQWRAFVLLKLARAGEAQRQGAEALQSTGSWFEKDAAELKAVLGGKTPA